MTDEEDGWVESATQMLEKVGVPVVDAAAVDQRDALCVVLEPRDVNLGDLAKLLEYARPALIVVGDGGQLRNVSPSFGLLGGAHEIMVTVATSDFERDEAEATGFSIGMGPSGAEEQLVNSCLDAASAAILKSDDDWEPESSQSTFDLLRWRALLDNPDKAADLESLIDPIHWYRYKTLIDRTSNAKRNEHHAAWRENADSLAEVIWSESKDFCGGANLTVLRKITLEYLQRIDYSCASRDAAEPVTQALSKLMKLRRLSSGQSSLL